MVNTAVSISENNTRKTRMLKMLDVGKTSKYYILSAFAGVSSAGSISAFSSNIVQGASNSQRIGDVIEITHMDLQLSWAFGDAFNRVRTLIIYVPGKTAINTVGDVLANGPLTGVGPDCFSFVQMGLLRMGAEVLYDNRAQVSQYWQPVQEDTIRIKINKKFVYQPSLTPSQNGEIFIVYISDSSVAPHPTAVQQGRVYFRDVTI